MRKTILQVHYSSSVQKTASKNTKYSRNETIFKIAKNRSTRSLELFCAKARSEKHQIFEIWEYFENRPSCKGYSPWMAIAQNGQFRSKMKNAKNMQKTILQEH